MQSDRQAVTAYVALGANLGDRASNLRAAIDALDRIPGVDVRRASSFLDNPAVGGPAGAPAFLNAVAELATTLDPQRLLRGLLDVERRLGRQRRTRWEPRPIDLDLILYGDRVIDLPQLKVPHPLMHERRFVLQPLAEIAPEVVHPVLGQTARSLLARAGV